MSTNSTSTSASIYRGIKLGYISPGKYYSFPLASATTAIAIAIAVARARARAAARVAARILYMPCGKVHTGPLARVD
jgi:hypothetical protein